MIWACPSFGNWRSLRSRQFPRSGRAVRSIFFLFAAAKPPRKERRMPLPALTQSFLLKIKHLPSMKSSKKNIKFSNIKISKNDR